MTPIPPLPTRAPITIAVVVAWLVILAAAAALIAEASDYRRLAPTQANAANLKLELASRYAVGSKLLFEHIQTPTKPNLAQIIDQIRSDASTPADRLRLIPVIAELSGNDAAARAAADCLQSMPPPDVASDVAILEAFYAKGARPSDTAELRLEARYGWFGSLAVSQMDPHISAIRAEVASAAERTAVAVFVAAILGVMFLMAGIALFIVFAILISNGKLPIRYAVSDPRISDVLLEGFAIYLSLMAVLSLAGRLLPARHPELNTLLLIPVLAALAWVRARGVWGAPLAIAVGWNRGRGIAREIFAGIAGYIAGLPLLGIGIIVFLILARFSSTHASHPIEFEITEGGWVRVLIVFLASIFAPVTEELMFRGFLLRHLTGRLPLFLSAVLVSVIFAAIHPQGWTAIPMLGTIGLVLALIRIRRDSLVASIAAHSFNNTLLIVIMLVAAG